MKRTSAAIALLAGLGGCASPDKAGTADGARPFNQVTRGQAVANVQNAKGMPVALKQASATGKPGGGVVQVRADAPGTIDNMVVPTAGLGTVRVNGMGAGGNCADGSCNPGGGAGNGLPAYGPQTNGIRQLIGHGAGILPVPAMGVPGAVAFPAGMAGAGSGMYAGMYAPGRTQVRFASPAGMKVTWRAAGGGFPDSGLEAPSRYNFPQMNIYGLRLSGIPNRPGKNYYPTLEVYGATPKTITYLSHNTVPLAFTDEDFEAVNAGNLVVKVIYLPDEKYQDIAAVAGAEELVSTRLEPGANPIEEANRKGTILAVVRIGNIDLQDPNIPPLDAPAPGMMPPPTMMPAPGVMPARPLTPTPGLMPPSYSSPSVPMAAPGTMPATLPSGLRPTPSPVLGAKPVGLPK